MLISSVNVGNLQHLNGFNWFQAFGQVQKSPPQVIFLLVMLDPNNLGEAALAAVRI